MESPRWSEDKECYKVLLELLGYSGPSLDVQLFKMELKEAHSLSLLQEYIPPRLKDNVNVEIDHAWIEGETCSPLFDRLTNQERYVLFVLYNEEDPATFLGMTPETYRRIIREIRRKLADDFKD